MPETIPHRDSSTRFNTALQDVRHGLKSADLFGVWKVIRAKRDSRNINPISIGTSTFTQHQCAEGAVATTDSGGAAGAVAAVPGPAGNGTTATQILPRGQKTYSKKVPFFGPPDNAKQTHGPQTGAALRPPKWTQRGVKRSIFLAITLRTLACMVSTGRAPTRTYFPAKKEENP